MSSPQASRRASTACHVVKIAARGIEHGEPRRIGLDGEARLDQLQRADQVETSSAELAFGLASGDERAAAEPPRDQPGALQLIERAADGAARRAEGHGELPLGRKLVAVAIGAGLDGAPQMGEIAPTPRARPCGGSPALPVMRSFRRVRSVSCPSTSNWTNSNAQLEEIGLQSVRDYALITGERRGPTCRKGRRCRLRSSPQRIRRGEPEWHSRKARNMR